MKKNRCPIVVGQAQRRSGDQIFDPAAFTVPTVGADAIDNPKAARRNFLTGPGTWGVNLGIQKAFHLGERVQMNFGAEFNNIFNHPLFSPDNSDFANLGSFAIGIDPKTNRIQDGGPCSRFCKKTKPARLYAVRRLAAAGRRPVYDEANRDSITESSREAALPCRREYVGVFRRLSP
jgi:hypothetical protein